MGRLPGRPSAGQAGVVITEGASPGRWSHSGHLARRFAGSLSRRPPPSDDEAWAAIVAAPSGTDIVEIDGERRPAARDRGRPPLSRPAAERRAGSRCAGALLHDVGKVESGLGVTGRVVATVVGPRTRRFRLYHDHEEIGAGMAADAGSDSVTVALIAGSRGAPGLDDLRAADDI